MFPAAIERFAVLLAVAAGLPCGAVAADCQASAGKNGSVLCVSLKLDSGKIAVADSRLYPNGSLRKGRAVAQDLTGDVGAAVARLNKPFWFALSRDQRRRARKGEFEDAENRKTVRDFSGGWQPFVDSFVQWTQKYGTAEPGSQVLSEAGLFRPLITIHFGSALMFEGFEGNDAATGRLVFRVADRFDPGSEETLLIEVPSILAAAEREQRIRALRKSLAPLRGSIWCRQRIEQRIREFYAPLGLEPEFEQVDPRRPVIRIVERKAKP